MPLCLDRMNKPEAVCAVLKHVGRPMSVKDIAKVLKENGFTIVAANHLDAVTNGLRARHARYGDVCRVDRGVWAYQPKEGTREDGP